MFKIVSLMLLHFCVLLNASEKNYHEASKKDITTITLSNGINAVFVDLPNSPVYSLRIIVHSGGSDNMRPKTGLAHYLEHLMFKVTPFKNQHLDFLQSNNILFNAETGPEFTQYIHFSFEKSKLEHILAMEVTRFLKFIVDDKVAANELQTVTEEFQMIEHDPMHTTPLQTLFNGQNIGIPVIGYKNDLKTLTKQDAAQFHAMHYTPDNITIVLVGDIKSAKIEDLLEKHFGKLSGKRPPRIVQKLHSDEKTHTRFYVKKISKFQKNDIIHFTWKIGPTISKNFSEFCALQIMSEILNGEFGLLHEYFIKNKKIASWIKFSCCKELTQTSIPTITMVLMPGIELSDAEEEVTNFLKKVAEQGFEEKQFKTSQKAILASIAYVNDDINSIASMIAWLVASEVGPDKFYELESSYESTTIRFVNRVFRKYFSNKPDLVTIITGDSE